MTALLAPDRPVPTVEQAHVVPLRDAAYWLGIKSDNTAYQLAKSGRLAPGVPVLRVAGRWVVPTAKLRAALGLDVEPVVQRPRTARHPAHARAVVMRAGLVPSVERAARRIRDEDRYSN